MLKRIKHFAEESFSVFNRTPSDTLQVFFWQNNLLFFFNIHEQSVLYQFMIFISKIH